MKQHAEKYLSLQTSIQTAAATIASELPALRQARGLSQFDLAGYLDISQSEVASIENGHRQPTKKFINRLLRYLEAERYVDIATKSDADGLYRWTIFESHPSDTGDESVVADGRAPSRDGAIEAAEKYLI